MKKILCFVLAILCLLAVAGCGGGAKKAEVPAQKQAAAEKVLRVGTDADYPPFEYYQESTKAFIGFDVELVQGVARDDVELVQGVAREMGYSRVEFVDLEFNNLLPSLKDGQVDAVISCMNITEERKKAANFTEPYLVSSNVVIGPADANPGSVDVMKDKRIAAEIGSIHEKQVKKYSNTVIECGGAEEALKMIVDKKADFAVMDNYTARFFITNFYNGKLNIVATLPDESDNGIAIAVAKGNTKLLAQLNEGLQKYQAQASFHQMKNNYFGKLK